jgi:integrase
MKLPSNLALSRHGVYYYRIIYYVNSVRKERRWSLRTKNPLIAKGLSFKIGASLKFNNTEMNDDKYMAGYVTTFTNPSGGKIEIQVDANDPKDVAAGLEATKVILEAEAKQYELRFLTPDSTTKALTTSSVVTQDIATNSFEELFLRYQVRNKSRVSGKTAYEYERCLDKFILWLNKKRGAKNNLVKSVGRIEISGFIEAVHQDGVSLKTIQQKYLAALNGFFTYAQEVGEYPTGELPTQKHKLHTKREQRKSKSKTGWLPFSEEELSKIFLPEHYLARPKPCDFWLPILGIFTGARISELCQLKPENIFVENGYWAFNITDDDEDQTIKTEAGIRKIPMHHWLIKMGFLDYISDVKKYGGTIFPYMTPDQFNHYSKTPGRRFGEYLDTLGIVEKRKVFHSLRKNVNDKLKQNGVPEETRCQFIGHDHETTNSGVYSEPHSLEYLSLNVEKHIDFDSLINFDLLKYNRSEMAKETERLVIIAKRGRAHRLAKQRK